MSASGGFPRNPWRTQFRTIRASDPAYEVEGVRFLTVKSAALGRRADLCVWSPPDLTADAQDLPMVLLLHGVYGSAWIWAFAGGVHRTAQEMIRMGEIPALALVMPSDGLWGDGSGYCLHQDGTNYERWITEEVPQAACEALSCLSKDSPRFLAGLSMGGYGALRLGAKFPNAWRGVSAHSAITRIEEMALFVEEPLDFYAQEVAQDQSALYWILQNRDSLPPLRFDCGRDDLLIEPNRALHVALQQAGVSHQYQEFSGEHSWDYWREHIRDTLRFFASLASA